MYSFRPLTDSPHEVKKIFELMKTCFPQAQYLTETYLRWQYLENPAGKAVGFNAYVEDELVAHYVTLPCTWNIYGDSVRCLLSLNTATKPQHQGKGLFKKLAQLTYEEGRKRDFKYVFGVGNNNSTHGLIHSLKFQSLGPLRVMVGFGTPRLPLPKGPIYQDWNLESLKWRLACPNRQYWIEEHQESNAIYTHGGWPLTKVLIHSTSQKVQLPRKNPFSVTVWIGHHMQAVWPVTMFNLPMLLRPRPLNFTVLKLAVNFADLRLKDIVFEGIDFDAF